MSYYTELLKTVTANHDVAKQCHLDNMEYRRYVYNTIKEFGLYIINKFKEADQSDSEVTGNIQEVNKKTYFYARHETDTVNIKLELQVNTDYDEVNVRNNGIFNTFDIKLNIEMLSKFLPTISMPLNRWGLPCKCRGKSNSKKSIWGTPETKSQ